MTPGATPTPQRIVCPPRNLDGEHFYIVSKARCSVLIKKLPMYENYQKATPWNIITPIPNTCGHLYLEESRHTRENTLTRAKKSYGICCPTRMILFIADAHTPRHVLPSVSIRRHVYQSVPNMRIQVSNTCIHVSLSVI